MALLKKVAAVLALISGWTLVVLLVFDQVTTTKMASMQAPLHAEVNELRAKQGPLEQELAELRQQNAELADSLRTATAAPQVGVEAHADAVRPVPRRLGGVHNILAYGSNDETSGCVSLSTPGAAVTFDMSATTGSGANDKRVPPCVVALDGYDGSAINIKKCSSTLIGSTGLTNQVLELLFINEDDDTVMTINAVDNGGTVKNTYKLGARESVIGLCSSSSGDFLLFPRMTEICPKGCDKTAPADEAGNAFGTACAVAAGNAACAR